MKTYYIEIIQSVQPKNALQGSIINLIRLFDGKTCTDRYALLEHVKKEVADRNEILKRCQPLQVEMWGLVNDISAITIRNPNASWYAQIYFKLIKGELKIN